MRRVRSRIAVAALWIGMSPCAMAQINRVGAYVEGMKPSGEFAETASMLIGVGLSADLTLSPRWIWSAQAGRVIPLLTNSAKETFDKYGIFQLLTGPRVYFADEEAGVRPFAGVLGGLQQFGFKTKPIDPPLGDGYGYSDSGVRWSAAVVAGARKGDFDLSLRYAYFTSSGDYKAYGSLALTFAWMPGVDSW